MDNSYTNVAIHPPILDGTNYGPWKLKISIYIQSIDSKAWQRVLDGWSPLKRDEEGGGPKPRAQWTTDEIFSSNYNAKAINAIFNSVDMNMFNLIGTCVCARDAWEKLQTHCEGSTSVKKTRMRLLTSKFEKLIMEESETIMQYNTRLKSLANETYVLGDPIFNERLVCKVLRSVPKRFHTKVCAIDESKDTSIMGLDELISSLRTYEMEMEVEDDYKEKKKSEKGAKPLKFPSLPTLEKAWKPNTTRGPRQREYKGYGHYANECSNRLRKGKKNFQINPLGVGCGVATPGRNTIQKSVCFVASKFDNSNDHEEQVAEVYTLEGIQKLYEELYSDWIKRNKLNTTITKENTELKAAVARLEVLMSKKDMELGLLNSELEKGKTNLAKFNSSLDKLDSLLSMGKDDKLGIIFKNSVFKIGESSKSSVFVKEGSNSLNHPSVVSKGKKPISDKTVTVPKTKQLKRPFVCHYCLKPGHIRPFCRKLKNEYLLWESKKVLPPVLHNTKRNWYFDSESSRHMTGTRSADNCYQLGEELACRHSKVDDFSLWHQNLGHVNFKTLKNLSKFEAVRGLTNLKSGVPYICGACQKVSRIRTDHGKEFENSSFSSLCDKKSISQEFSIPKTPQQNYIAERKNRTLQEMTMVMMSSKNISKRFWEEALNTTCHISNRVYLRSGSSMTSYEILMGKRQNINYFHVFGCVCYVLNDRNHLAKFDSKSYKCLFLGYSTNIRAYKMYNLRTRTIMEYINIVFDDFAYFKEPSVVPDVTTPSTTPVPPETDHEDSNQSDEETELITEKDIPSKIQKNHPSSQIIGDVHGTRKTRAKDKVDYRKMVGLVCMSSVYSQVERVDFDENFAPVALIESVQLFLVIECHMGIKLYQMDVKSAFLNDILSEEVYQSDPKVTHLKAVMRILKYVSGTLDLGLWYTRETNTNLFWFSDADWAGDVNDRKSTTGLDPQDIRSEMGYQESDVSAGVTTPKVPSSPLSLPIVPVPAEPIPLDDIMHEDPGNKIDLDNPPNFSVLNRVHPAPPIARRSKRQAGFNPDFTPSKRFYRGPRISLADDDHTSGDDSNDCDYEFVARKNSSNHTAASASASASAPVAKYVSESSASSSSDGVQRINGAKYGRKAQKKKEFGVGEEPQE
ncbi:uncharacterized protein [Henckelia pumila]|uniref:uncharacterized protein n=1 Tax=Henckelia pumila TaxID=405737 RepID=UPI003C6E5C4D